MEIARESRSRSRTPFVGDVVDTDLTSTAEASVRVTRQRDKPKSANGLTNGGQEKTETVTMVTETVTVIETKTAKDIVNRNKAKPARKKIVEKEVSKIVEQDVAVKRTTHKEKTDPKKLMSWKSQMEVGDYSSDEEAMRTVSTYRAAGEWWNAFPKTDFTYSPASLHRQQQVAPGVKALPNMSRRSLGSVAGQHDSSFVSATATAFSARKVIGDGRTPPLPYKRQWIRGQRASLGQLSDAESDTEESARLCSTTRTETMTTTTTTLLSVVWSRITTTVVSLLVLMDPRAGVHWVLDSLYLLLAWVRVLDARVLYALPSRPRKAVFVPLLLLPLLLLAALWLARHLGDAPVDAISAITMQSLAPFSAFWANHGSPWSLWGGAWSEGANREEAAIAAAAVTARFEATVATQMPIPIHAEQASCSVSCPSAEVSDVIDRVLASPALLALLRHQRDIEGAEIQRRLDAGLATAERLQDDRLHAVAEQVAEHATKETKPQVLELLQKVAALQVAIETSRQEIIALKLQQAPAPIPDAAPAKACDDVNVDVESVMLAMLARYDADKTGRADFALESLGGSVLSTRCSETHATTAASITLLGFPLWTQPTSPRAAIQPGTLPGQCWAFKGARGFLVVQLSALVRLSSVSIEHTPRSLARNGRIDSAPRRMRLLGLVTLEDPEPVDLATFEFLEDGPSLQTFPVKVSEEVPAFRIVELQIESNHGNQEYTCLYRFRVHGTHVDN